MSTCIIGVVVAGAYLCIGQDPSPTPQKAAITCQTVEPWSRADQQALSAELKALDGRPQIKRAMGELKRSRDQARLCRAKRKR